MEYTQMFVELEHRQNYDVQSFHQPRGLTKAGSPPHKGHHITQLQVHPSCHMAPPAPRTMPDVA